MSSEEKEEKNENEWWTAHTTKGL